MNIHDINKNISLNLKVYQEILKNVPEDEFFRSPQIGSWSVSEVYCHIIHVTTVSLLAIEKCLHGKQMRSSSSLPFITKIIFLFGQFPPIKLKAPENIAAKTKKIEKEEARNGLIKVIQRLDSTVARLSKSSSNCRISHPKLGMLNSYEWLRFIDIHNKHHLKQIKKIQKINARYSLA